MAYDPVRGLTAKRSGEGSDATSASEVDASRIVV
jgi:hypothetical protein